MRKRNQHYVKNIIIYDSTGNVVQKHELDKTGRLIRQSETLFSKPSIQKPVPQVCNPIPMPLIKKQLPQTDLELKQELFRNFPITPKMRSKPINCLQSLFLLPKFQPTKIDNIDNVFGSQHSIIQQSCI